MSPSAKKASYWSRLRTAWHKVFCDSSPTQYISVRCVHCGRWAN